MTTTVPFRIGICGLEELPDHCAIGVSHVLSILDPDWPVPEAFGGYGEHSRLELRFHDIIEEQKRLIAPRREHVERLLAFGQDLAADPAAHLLVHCHAGVSRSTASMALILAQAMPQAPAEAVFDEVRRIRPQAWPNLRILEMGDAALGRGGALVAAVARLYRLRMQQEPELADEFRAGGRGREVELGLRQGA